MKHDIIHKNELTREELKKIQLEIMDEINFFCRTHNIKYFLLGGTLIGAIRHKGYIPWDDDIDIGLERKEYNRLLEEFSSVSGKIKIITKNNYKNYIYPYAKAIHEDTILIETDKKHAIGVNIDIFPIDDMPDNIDECKRILKKVKFYRNILTLKYLHIDINRSILKNAIIIFFHYPLKLISNKLLLNKLDNTFTESRQNSSRIFGANLGGAWGEKEIFYFTDISKQIEVDFEGRKYFIPLGYDRVLRKVYGDYMKIPPKEKQITHHGFKAYWKL